MNLYEANTLARKLMMEHGLYDWKFDFHNRKRSLGTCSYSKRTIYLSKITTPQLTVEQVRDTILHEIAHAIIGPQHGHNHVWRRKAREIGCSGERTANVEISVRYKYIATCPACGKEVGMSRKPTRSYSHNCGSYRGYSENRKLTFIQQY